MNESYLRELSMARHRVIHLLDKMKLRCYTNHEWHMFLYYFIYYAYDIVTKLYNTIQYRWRSYIEFIFIVHIYRLRYLQELSSRLKSWTRKKTRRHLIHTREALVL